MQTLQTDHFTAYRSLKLAATPVGVLAAEFQQQWWAVPFTRRICSTGVPETYSCTEVNHV